VDRISLVVLLVVSQAIRPAKPIQQSTRLRRCSQYVYESGGSHDTGASVLELPFVQTTWPGTGRLPRFLGSCERCERRPQEGSRCLIGVRTTEKKASKPSGDMRAASSR